MSTVAKGAIALSSAKSRVEPPKTVSLADIKVLAEALSKVLEDDKAEDIAFIELQGKSSLADFMIIASGRSGRHVAALAEHVAQEAKRLTGRPASVEGMANADWVLIYGHVIVHLFRPEVREFYNLEKIWMSDQSAHRTARASS